MSQLKVWNGSAWVNALVGAQGPVGPTGASGSSGVATATSPITNTGTVSSAQLGLNQTLLPKGLHRKMVSGRYYYPSSADGFRSTTTYSLNISYYAMFEVPSTTTFDRMITGISRGATGTVFRMGIYNADWDTLLPSTLVLDAGTVSTGSNFTVTNATGTGSVATYTANNTLTAGQVVAISGITPTVYNTGGLTVLTATSTEFTVASAASATYVSGGTGGTVSYPSITINQTLTAGLYYLVLNAQGSTSPIAYYFNGNTSTAYTLPTTTVSAFGGSYAQSSVTGALPATANLNVVSNVQIVSPYIGMRAA